MSNAPQFADRLLRPRQIHAPGGILPIGRSTFYELVRDPQSGFPPGRWVTPSIRAWSERELLEWSRRPRTKFAAPGTLAALDLAARQRLGVTARQSAAARRFATLFADMLRRGLTPPQFAELRHAEGAEPFLYKRRDGTEVGYSFDWLLRGLRAEAKRQSAGSAALPL